VTNSDLLKSLNQFGEISNIVWEDSFTKFNGYALISFQSQESLTQALEKKTLTVRGKSAHISPLPKTEDETNRVICIHSFSKDVTDDHIVEFFREVGEIEQIDWDRQSQEGQSHGWVLFADPSSVERAWSLRGRKLLGLELEMELDGKDGRYHVFFNV